MHFELFEIILSGVIGVGKILFGFVCYHLLSRVVVVCAHMGGKIIFDEFLNFLVDFGWKIPRIDG